MNREIKTRDLSALYVTGPGHGGPGLVANAYLEGTYSEVYPGIGLDEEGLRRLFRQFSFPGGIPSHVAPETPGSIHEGGELGYALVHAYGAAFDNPDLVVACVVGDGEAETGRSPRAGTRTSSSTRARDGAVLPILHLNGYKIANPTVLARISDEELAALFEGYGYRPTVVGGRRRRPGESPSALRGGARRGARRDRAHPGAARADGAPTAAAVADDRSANPEGLDGPEEVDGLPMEGTWRSHQVPMTDVTTNTDHRELLEEWMRSYRPEELFDDEGGSCPSSPSSLPRASAG